MNPICQRSCGNASASETKNGPDYRHGDIEICMMDGRTFETRIDEPTRNFVQNLHEKSIFIGDVYINPKYIAYIRPATK